jgi:hypothetical protein
MGTQEPVWSGALHLAAHGQTNAPAHFIVAAQSWSAQHAPVTGTLHTPATQVS